MDSTFRNSFYIACALAILLGFWLMQHWRAENQVRLHSEHLLRQIEKRNTLAVGDFIAKDYQDDWGDDRALLLSRLRLVLRSFTSLTIKAAEPEMVVESGHGTWKASVQLNGTGSEMAPEIIRRINSLTTPFELHWRNESWKPWDWKLVRVKNDSLQIREF